MTIDFRVKDLTLAEAGRDQIRLAEHEMPGLMKLRAEYSASRPLEGARITGCLHMTVQTAVLIETLVELGADVRWASCNIFSTQDEAAAAVVVGKGTVDNPLGVPVFAWKGETLAEYWECIADTFNWPDGQWPNLLLDDGGDATMFAHVGYDPEQLDLQSADGPHIRAALEKLNAAVNNVDFFNDMIADLRGSSEETTTGVHRMQQQADSGKLLIPIINVNDSVTKSKFDNRYGIRHSLPDGLNRATDTLIGGKVALIAGYGDVGKGAAEAMRGQGARVIISEVDPICALQAVMDGYQVARIEDVLDEADFYITATGNKDVITVEHMRGMRHQAIIGNIGHFDNEIDMAGLQDASDIKVREIKPQVHEWDFGDHTVIILSEGRLLNLGNATGHPSFVMSTSFANQVLAQIELWNGDYGVGVHRLPKQLDEKVARLHLEQLGVQLTELTLEQAEYLGVAAAGPYKAEHYRY